MKKIYKTPEMEVFKTLMSENILEESGQVGPLGNENNTFEETETPLEVGDQQVNLWDD